MKPTRLIALAALALVAFGCEDDKDPAWWQAGTPTAPAPAKTQAQPVAKPVSGTIVGTWKLATPGAAPWFAHFASDGSWKITDDQAGAKRRVYGSYNVSGSAFKGSMTNPGIGDGEINGTITGNTMSMDFIEHWHTPYKHVPYTGSKL